jgi:imidazolonepropionase
MRKVTLIRGARQLLTLRGPSGPRRGADLRNLGLIQDGAVLIVDGLIREVGPTRRLENLALAREAEEIDASGCVVMPGFVDSHTHVVARTVHEMSQRKIETLALRAVEEAVRHGTTTLEAKSGELKILRIHSALQKRFVPVVSTFSCARPTPGYEQRPDDYVGWICSRILPLVKRRRLAEFADICCGGNGFALDLVRPYLASARELGFALKIHTSADPPDSAIPLAVELGATSVDQVLDPSEQDIESLARSQTIATLLPGSVFNQGCAGYAPARKLIDRGVAIALATNYDPETSPSQNMQMVIALACRSMNMTPAEAIAATTLNAAYALRRASSVGSLEIGKSADLLLLSVSDYRELPYHFGMNLVKLVMKRGAVLVERSEVTWPAD